MKPSVAAFTDTYHPTVNGVTYAIETWADRWRTGGGRMDVVYPRSSHRPAPNEYPVRSVRFPFYEGYRLGAPQVPDAVEDVDVVHSHTAFAVGLGGLRLARRKDVPLVASYHTPTGEYTDYFTESQTMAEALERATTSYERWFYDRADVVLVPTEPVREHMNEVVEITSPVRVLSNGVDVEFFEYTDPDAFLARHGLDDAETLVGYTGRHGYEKRLFDLVEAADGLDATVVLGGDGPSNDDLRRRAATLDADVRFLGFLERHELPAFYSALDVFAFPSPVETEGLVALEAYACGTPVVGANEGALSNTVEDDVTGYHFETGDVEGFRDGIRRAVANNDRLSERCLDRRDEVSVDHAVAELAEVYAEVRR